MAVALCSSLLSGCARKLNELVFVIDTDLPLPLRNLAFLLRQPTMTNINSSGMGVNVDLASPPWTVSVRDVGAGDRELVFTAFAETTSGERVVYRGRTRFVLGQRKIVQVFLSRACTGFLQQQEQSCDPASPNPPCCPTGTSCRAGVCADEFIDPATLPNFSPELAMSRLDGGSVADASMSVDSGANDGASLDTTVVTDARADAADAPRDVAADTQDGASRLDGASDGAQLDGARDATSDARDTQVDGADSASDGG